MGAVCSICAGSWGAHFSTFSKFRFWGSGSKSLGLGYMICAQFVQANAIYRSKKSHGNWNIWTFEIIWNEFRTIVCPSEKFRGYSDISVLFNTFQYISVHSVCLCISIGSIYQLKVNKDRVHMWSASINLQRGITLVSTIYETRVIDVCKNNENQYWLYNLPNDILIILNTTAKKHQIEHEQHNSSTNCEKKKWFRYTTLVSGYRNLVQKSRKLWIILWWKDWTPQWSLKISYLPDSPGGVLPTKKWVKLSNS